MREREIDVLLATEPASMYYLTGFALSAHYHRQFVIITHDNEDPVWFGREAVDGVSARRTVYMSDDNVVTHRYRYDGPSLETTEYLAEYIADQAWQNASIGVEAQKPSFPYHCGQLLKTKLPNVTFVDVSNAIDTVRVIKSDAELALTREGGVIAAQAMSAARDTINVGVRQSDTAAAVFQTLIRGTDELSGYWPEGICLLGGDRLSAYHTIWTDKRYADGEEGVLELGGSRYGYNCGLTRVFSLGAPDPDTALAVNVAREGIESAKEIMRAGERAGNVAQVFHDCVKRHGRKTRSMTGYFLGIGLPSADWIEYSGGDISVGDETVLQENMVVHFIPQMETKRHGFIMAISETFAIREGAAAERLSSFDTDLIIK